MTVVARLVDIGRAGAPTPPLVWAVVTGSVSIFGRRPFESNDEPFPAFLAEQARSIVQNIAYVLRANEAASKGVVEETVSFESALRFDRPEEVCQEPVPRDFATCAAAYADLRGPRAGIERVATVPEGDR